MNLKSKATLVVLLFLLAFLVRSVYLLEVKDQVIFYRGGAEASFFEEWANIKQSTGWVDRSAPFREPLFSYFLSLVRMNSKSPLVLGMVQALLGSVATVLIYLIGEKLHGKGTAIVASIAFALYPPAVFYSTAVNEAVLATFLVILGFYLILRKQSLSSAFYSGLVIGLAFLTRFMLGITIVPFAIYLGLCHKSSAKKTIIALIVGLIVPVVIYHGLLLKTPERCLFPTRSGWQFFLAREGNTQPATSAVASIEVNGQKVRTEVSSDLLKGENDAKRFARIETGKQLEGRKLNLHWFKRGSKISGKQAMLSYLRRIGYLFGRYAPATDFDLRFVVDFAPILKIGILATLLLLPLGIMGIGLSTNKQSIAITSFALIYGLLSPLLLISEIDKLPLAAVVAIPFGAFCISAYRWISNRLIIKSLITLIVAGLLTTFLSFAGAKMDRSAQLVLLGNAYHNASLFDDAQKAYQEALNQNPNCVDAYLHIARLHANRRNPQAALKVLEDAISAGIDNPKILLEKASMLLLLGQIEQAKQTALLLAESHPLLPHVNQVAGACLIEQGNARDAIDYLVKEIEYGSPDFITYGSLGRAYLEIKDYQKAASNLETALRIRPPATPAATWVAMLADAYMGQGYHLKACNLLSEYVRSDPGNISLGFKFANALYRAERYEDALKQLKHLRKISPANTTILLNMAAVYVQVDSLDQAGKVWQEVLKIDPNNSTAKENLKELRK